MTNNPFIKKASERHEQTKRTALRHVYELERLLRRYEPGEKSPRDLEARLEEAREVAKRYT